MNEIRLNCFSVLGAVHSFGSELAAGAETLRQWVVPAQVDEVVRAGGTSQDPAEIKG